MISLMLLWKLPQASYPFVPGPLYSRYTLKPGHQIAGRHTKRLENSNDIDKTSNDLEMTLNSLFSSYLTYHIENWTYLCHESRH